MTNPLICSACGAPLTVPPDADQVKCSACGTTHQIQRGEDYVALKAAEHVAKALVEAQSVSQAEFKKLQVSQQIGLLEMQLSSVQGDIRETQLASASPPMLALLQELYIQEYTLTNKLRPLKLEFAQLEGANALEQAAAHHVLVAHLAELSNRIEGRGLEAIHLKEDVRTLCAQVEDELVSALRYQPYEGAQLSSLGEVGEYHQAVLADQETLRSVSGGFPDKVRRALSTREVEIRKWVAAHQGKSDSEPLIYQVEPLHLTDAPIVVQGILADREVPPRQQETPEPLPQGGRPVMIGCGLGLAILIGGSLFSLVTLSIFFSPAGEEPSLLFVPLFFLFSIVWTVLAVRAFVGRAARRISNTMLHLFLAVTTGILWADLMMFLVGILDSDTAFFAAVSFGLIFGPFVVGALAWYSLGRPRTILGVGLRKLFFR